MHPRITVKADEATTTGRALQTFEGAGGDRTIIPLAHIAGWVEHVENYAITLLLVSGQRVMLTFDHHGGDEAGEAFVEAIDALYGALARGEAAA